MNAFATASIVFVTLFGATLLGMRLRAALPEHHLAPDAKDAVKVGMGSVATMAALVLGLLVASTKSSYDTERNEVIHWTCRLTGSCGSPVLLCAMHWNISDDRTCHSAAAMRSACAIRPSTDP